jgi:phosphoribosylformylglycinamidine synthase
MSEPLWEASVYVTLKPVVNDPQGLAIRGGLHQMGYTAIESVRAGKFLQLTIRAVDRSEAERQIDEICRRLLANPVIEDFRYTLIRARRAGRPAARATG